MIAAIYARKSTASQRGYQNLLDIGTKGGTVDRPIEHGRPLP